MCVSVSACDCGCGLCMCDVMCMCGRVPCRYNTCQQGAFIKGRPAFGLVLPRDKKLGRLLVKYDKHYMQNGLSYC